MTELKLVRDWFGLWHVWSEDVGREAATKCAKRIVEPPVYARRSVVRLPYTGPRGTHPAWPYRTLLEPSICGRCPWYAELSPEREDVCSE